MTQRTNYCGLITQEYLNQTVNVKGWIHSNRDFGGVIFLDIRDREGIVQVVIEPDNQQCFGLNLKTEYVVSIHGMVRLRSNPNREIPNGNIEIVAQSIEILNTAVSPLPIIPDDDNSEMNRMQYRILDLRSQKMQHNLRLRYNVSMETRKFLDANGFIDIETPFLTRSTPEGARDFLVPSRINHGSFYALPQSPQLFKQLLMVAGFDRYYQIVRCFRDEDLRSDRQPEFTQIDIETSFLTEQEIRDIAEKLIRQVFKNILNVQLPEFVTMSYKDAMHDYGVDKPDLRIPLKFADLTHIFTSSEFKVFANVSNGNGRIVALTLPDTGCQLSRKTLDEYAKFVENYGLSGLAYIKVNNPLSSPILKYLSQNEIDNILNCTQAQQGDTIFIAASTNANTVNQAMGALRLKLGNDYNLYTTTWAPLWVLDFPLLEYSEEDNRYIACHHPFTAPKATHVELLDTNPSQCLAQAYDMVLNGWEIGGGSIRIHDAIIQAKVFDAIALTQDEAYAKFGFLLDNLQYGAPPHGGIAFGLDRIATLMCQADSIRDVIAFPKTIKGQCLLTDSPNIVDSNQLSTLGIRTFK